jgi:hypothetical protein
MWIWVLALLPEKARAVGRIGHVSVLVALYLLTPVLQCIAYCLLAWCRLQNGYGGPFRGDQDGCYCDWEGMGMRREIDDEEQESDRL